MDPDKALAELRKGMGRLQEIIDRGDTSADPSLIDEKDDILNRMIDVWGGFDRWMSMQGAAPKDWGRGQR